MYGCCVVEGTCNRGMAECVLMTETSREGHFMFVHMYVHAGQSVSQSFTRLLTS